MYPNGDLVSQSSSSMSKAVDDQQQQQQQEEQQRFQRRRQLLQHNHQHYQPQTSQYDPISAFRNLTLSHHSPPENGMSNNVNGLVDAAAYLPQTLEDYWPIPRARNGATTQPIGNNNMMTYYPPPPNMSPPPSPYNIGGQQVLGMADQYPLPHLYNAHAAANLASFPCNMQYPAPFSPALPNRLYPNTSVVPPQGGLPALYPDAADERRLITVDMLANILRYPFEYMTNSSLNRSLNMFLCKFSSTKFIDEFVMAITSSKNGLVDAACNYYGSNLIQTLIKVAKKRAVIAHVPRILADATVLLMTNQSGMHVVKQCFIELEEDKYKPLYDNMMENYNWFKIATDKHGCRGLNECLDYMVHDFKAGLLARIAANAQTLALDVYGTYIVQHVLDLRTEHTDQIVDTLLPFLEVLCTTKNGSHLVEKCLDTYHSSLVIRELVEKHKLVRLALHECANYVIQKAIKRSRGRDSELHEKLIKILSKERTALQVNKHGKYVAKLLPEHQV
ncbi:uncharacterized protein LOC141593966 isoform X2 [Silene latifolia]|uniref:uncharacterized protein LOC141593966 isoform X2 n=1 Tax=Silene latifolia TaxID=37657 RepID=UPI003D77E47A